MDKGGIRLTTHARKRLLERFGISGQKALYNLNHKINTDYILVENGNERQIREIEFNGEIIQAIIVDSKVVTIIEDCFLMSDDIMDMIRDTKKENKQLKTMVKYLQRKVDAYERKIRNIKNAVDQDIKTLQ